MISIDDEIIHDNDRVRKVADELTAYLEELHSDHIMEKLNDAFSSEINTIKAANELLQYYSTRANLKPYTLETELPRMQYTVYPDDRSPPLTSVSEIQNRYMKNEDIQNQRETQKPSDSDVIWRAANQSLLADAIATLTCMQRPLVRPDLLITAIAQHCHFILRFDSPRNKSLNCTCDLVLQIPNFERPLAKITIQIFFVPSSTTLTCQTLHVHPTPLSQKQIQEMASTLVRDLFPKTGLYSNRAAQ